MSSEYQIYLIESKSTNTGNKATLEAQRWHPEDDTDDPLPPPIPKWLSDAQKPLLLISMFILVLHFLSLVVFCFNKR